MKDYGNLSVRGAKEQLQAIFSAKDFLRGSQEEFPDMYSHYQKQIDDLSKEEKELNSWLGKNGGFDNGGSIWDDEEDYYDDAAAQEEISHFNDDLYEGDEARGKTLEKALAEDWGRELSTPEAPKAKPIGTYTPDERGFGNQPVPFPLIIGKEGYTPKIKNLPLEIDDGSENDWEVPVYDSEGNLINPDKSIGGSTWYSPDGSGESIDDFQVIDNGNGDERVDSKTAWQIISDWVKGDDGDIDNGSFQTDPKSGRRYYVTADGERMPLAAFGINEREIFPGVKVNERPAFDGSLASPEATPNIVKLVNEDTYGISPSAEVIGVTDGSQESADGYPEGLSADTPHTDENKAKYDAIYNANLEEIETLEAERDSLLGVSTGTGTSFPDIDNRLTVLYNQNRRIKEWRDSENTKPAGAENPSPDTKPAEGNNGDSDENLSKRNRLVEIANKQVKENGIGDIGAVYQDWAGLGRNQPWCVAFARYCADKAGIKLPNENSSTELEKWYKKNNKLSPSIDPEDPKKINYPKPGDLVFVNNDDKSDADHTAVVIAVNGDEITTIEGNMGYAPYSETVVKRKTYKYNSETGFVCTDTTGATIISIGRN